jgi:sulfotransferase family protein
MKPQKVFCIGAHKTGTTSMAEALSMLGYDVFPELLWYDDPSLQDDFYAGRYSRVAALIDRYEAFEDSPFNHSDFYVWLYERFPEARFILTVRDTANLIASHKRWYAKLHEYVLARDERLAACARMLYRTEYGQRSGIDDECALARIYEARNRAVRDFFQANRAAFLELDIEKEPQPWRVVCEFLGEPVPSSAFPHAKRTK